jgi:hypothetical protein
MNNPQMQPTDVAYAGQRITPKVHRIANIVQNDSGLICWLSCIKSGCTSHHKFDNLLAAQIACEQFLESGIAPKGCPP